MSLHSNSRHEIVNIAVGVLFIQVYAMNYNNDNDDDDDHMIMMTT